MRNFSDEEILELLAVQGGSEQEQAAAKAVVLAAIQENLRLGRAAKASEESSWNRNRASLRSEISPNW